MQNRQIAAADLSLDKKMSKSEISIKLRKAKQWLQLRDFSAAKQSVLSPTLRYADDRLKSVFSRHESKYRIYSSIVNAADYLDDLHFLQYSVNQLETIPPSPPSVLRETVLPEALRYRDVMLSPYVAQTRKAGLGLIMTGISVGLVGRSGGAYGLGSTMMFVGTLAIVGARYFALDRLARSLDLKLHQQITNGHSDAMTIQDGLTDELAVIEQTAVGMLSSGVTLFGQFGERLNQMANASAPPRLAPDDSSATMEDRKDQQDNDQKGYLQLK